MDDVGFMALAEGLISYVDECFGRVAAWIAGLVLVAAPIAATFLAVLWFAR